jgi:hypothetical protein
MRAPNSKDRPATFSAGQWQVIEQSLAAVGVDLDAAMVEPPKIPGLPAWWPDDRTVPLCTALDIVWFYGGAVHRKRPPTPSERAKELREALAACKQALAALDRVGHALYYETLDQFSAGTDRSRDSTGTNRRVRDENQ